jgi:hypothetical protein
MIPALDAKSKIFSWRNINKRETYYIYGGYWLAEYESPKGLRFNTALVLLRHKFFRDCSICPGAAWTS